MGKPKIRFKGYTEDWEQRKLNEVAEKICVGFVGTCEKFYTDESGVPMYRTGNLNGLSLNRDDLKYVTNEFHQHNQKSQLKAGDILIARHGDSGKAVNYESSEEANCLNIVIIRPDFKKSNYKFLTNCINSPECQKHIKSLSAGSTQAVINTSEIEKLGVVMPTNIDEQNRIARYFSNLDNLITLHQRKCDETKKLKKCMLQKMFPKEGEKVPEIRFSGFAGDWKQRKLEEIVNRITRKNSKLISELPLTISAQQGLIDQNEFFDKRVASKDVSGYYLIKNGEFAYNKSTSNDAPWGAIKRLDRYENGVLSTLYIVFEIKDETLVNSDFLVAYYSTNLWHKGIHEIAAEGARNHGLLNIAPTDFFKTKLKLPADIEEQKEIGEYFKKIDLLITFHQQKCDELKNIKKFMLQNMFVSEK